MDKSAKIYIAGHTGMVGSAIKRNLESKGYNHFITKSIDELDLIDQHAVMSFFETEKPDYVFLAAAKVGGIVANNKYRAQFIYENLQIQNNIIHNSYIAGVKKLLFLGSSCIYPKSCPQPMREEYLLTGELEYTNEPYAIAKIAGIRMCESYNIQYGTNFIAVMPTNLYGPNDNYNLETSHVLPALIRKMHLAKCLQKNDWNSIITDINKRPIEGIDGNASKHTIINILAKYGITKLNDNESVVSVLLWGTGTPRREFLHADDAADACVYLMEHIDFEKLVPMQPNGITHASVVRNTHVNIGSGIDSTIKELAEMVKSIVGFEGEIKWDSDKPDGTYLKLQDNSKINNLGWKMKIELNKGIENIYKTYCE